MLCEPIPPHQALDWGLVNRVVPRADLDETVDGWVASLRAKLPRGAALHQEPAQLVARPGLVADGDPRARLALALDARDEAQGAIREFLDSRSVREEQVSD